jgi:hypothetical protein
MIETDRSIVRDFASSIRSRRTRDDRGRRITTNHDALNPPVLNRRASTDEKTHARNERTNRYAPYHLASASPLATLVGAAFLGAALGAAVFFTGAGFALGATVFFTGADFFTVLVAVFAGAGADFLKSAFTCIVCVRVREYDDWDTTGSRLLDSLSS